MGKINHTENKTQDLRSCDYLQFTDTVYSFSGSKNIKSDLQNSFYINSINIFCINSVHLNL